MIQLLLVDDQTIVRQGLKVLLDAQPDFQVVGEAATGAQAVSQVEALLPDVVLMDIRMPEMDGVAATQKICQLFPETKILVLSTFNDDDYVARVMQFGAKGYLLKDSHIEELAQAIRSIYQGFTQLGPGLFKKAVTSIRPPFVSATPPNPVEYSTLPQPLMTLTPREREVLCLIIAGDTNREIAESLYISERTVKNHITSILSRLNVRDRVQAAMFASPFLAQLKSPHSS
ncbi:MAG: response regulator transcription factor [Cyanobacteria bacterium P01_A01_bin.17]